MSTSELFTLKAICEAGLSGGATDVADALELLGTLTHDHKAQFWQWLVGEDRTIANRLAAVRSTLSQGVAA